MHIRNFRSIAEMTIDLDDYTALIGANGTGKSSVLYALQWFFDGGALDPSDVHDVSALSVGQRTPAPGEPVEVAVTFTALTAADRIRLEKYGRGETARFKRTWEPGAPKSKVIGNAMQGPGFAEVRQLTRVGEARQAYLRLRDELPDLPELTNPSRDGIDAVLRLWEDAPSNRSRLMNVDSEDASHMFGIGGTHILKQCIRMILVPAAADIAAEVGSQRRGSALHDLIGAMVASAGTAARDAWVDQNRDAVERLNRSMEHEVTSAAELQARRVNEKLRSLIPEAEVSFNSALPDWTPTLAPDVQTHVTIDGIQNDVSRQGHGIQRAVMIAMLQCLAPDEELGRISPEVGPGEDSDVDPGAEPNEAEAGGEPSPLIICIEEPEIYQHPVRARNFARVLCEIASTKSVQVVVATHSPYFARPDQFASIRRFSLQAGRSMHVKTSVEDLARRAETRPEQILKNTHKRLPTSFAEGFFADAVVLVEGDTDKAVLEVLAERRGAPLDANGIAVLEVGGKESVRIPHEMLVGLGVPVYVVADGDALGADRGPEEKRAQAHESHRASTEKLLKWIPQSEALIGNLPAVFSGPTVVCKNWTLWHDDIEHELEHWPSFVEALAGAGGKLRAKNMLAYRTAALEARADDIPTSLLELVNAITRFPHPN